jgi:hypothetical protein
MFSANWCSLVLVSVLLSACGRSIRSDVDDGHAGTPNAMASGGGAGEAPQPTLCFDSANLPSCSALSPRYASVGPVVILRASDVAEGARFTKLGGWAAFAQLPDERPPRVVLVPSWEETEPRIFEVEHGGLDIVAVFGAEHPIVAGQLSRAVAVGCEPGGCQLLVGREKLSVAPEFAFPRGVRIGGVIAGVERLCAYGDGFFCWEGGVWRERIAFAESGHIVAAAVGDPTAVLTAAGAVLLEDGEFWRAQSVSVPSPVGFDALDGTTSVIGAEGMWQVSSAGAAMNCRQMPPLLAAGLGRYGVRWLALDARGEGFLQLALPGDRFGWCRPDEGFAIEAIAANRIECTSPFLLAITQDALLSVFGPVGCFVD